jgi:hypothetical protein
MEAAKAQKLGRRTTGKKYFDDYVFRQQTRIKNFPIERAVSITRN